MNNTAECGESDAPVLPAAERKTVSALVKCTERSCFYFSPLPVSFIVSSGGVFVSGPGPA